VLIDRLRARNAHKRGGGLRSTTLESQHAQDVEDPEELFALHAALETLEGVDATLARVVDLKFFCGFTSGAIAAVHGVSERTVQRQWDKARLLLRAVMREPAE
jgi:DNA-directed RNA polymerase specialized sigma24 family protein